MSRRVLCLFLETKWWAHGARALTYTAQLGFEEGLRANGCQPVTITTGWLPRLRDICRRRSFDQVWVEIVHQEGLDDDLLAWIAELAPVRVGFVLESLRYDETIYARWPHYQTWAGIVRNRLTFFTHALACDELDAAELDAGGQVRACWWPQAVPRRFTADAPPPPLAGGRAVFRGSLYGDRVTLTQDHELRDLLTVSGPLEEGTIDPRLFDRLHMLAEGWTGHRLPGPRVALALYRFGLRRVRRRIFRRWLDALRGDPVVINLPHAVGTYPGRVVEGMAVGRPVVAWDVPGRPRNRALFEDGREILLFAGTRPAALAAALKRLRGDPALARAIATNGWRKVRRAHTIERRVEQILAWTDTGDAPVFS
jgi:hypothetical protein